MDRTRGIGGSDIAAIMGISPWNTAYGVYLDKIGEGKFQYQKTSFNLAERIFIIHTDK